MSREADLARRRIRYARLKAAGLCTHCGKTAASHGIFCEACYADYHKERPEKTNPYAEMMLVHDQRLAMGLCVECGEPAERLMCKCASCAETGAKLHWYKWKEVQEDA